MNNCRIRFKTEIREKAKDIIMGNATSFIDLGNKVLIPFGTSAKIKTYNQAYETAVRKSKEVNDRYGLQYGPVTSVDSTSKHGIHVNIHVPEDLITSYEVKHNQTEAEELVQAERDRMGDTYGEGKGEYYQTDNNNNSYSAETTKQVEEKVKAWLTTMGITHVNVKEIRDREGKVINAVAVAKMMSKVIQVVEGKADITTLPEEAAHFLVELLGENNLLVKSMMDKIESYPIYQETYNKYKDIYKGDINKIKKEAIGKQIAIQVVNNVDASVLELNNSKFNQFANWFNRFWNKIKELFGKIDSEDVFKTAGDMIISNKAVNGTLTDEILYQLDTSEQDKIVDKLDNKFTASMDKPTHKYTVVNNSNGKEQVTKDSISGRVKAANAKRGFKDRTDKQKAEDDVRRAYGDKIHADIDNILKVLIGKISGNEVTQEVNTLDSTTHDIFKTYLTNLMNSFPAGTKFYSEKIIYNEDTKEPGTIDFMAVEPDGTVSIIDWKTTEFKNKNADGKIVSKSVPWYKEEDYNIQMTGYKQALRASYGVSKFGKVRIVPISIEYKRNVPTKIEIGDVNMLIDPARPYLSPIPISGLKGSDVELTGDAKTDELIKVLLQRRANIKDKMAGSVEEKVKKAERLERINDAIKELQLTQDIKSMLTDAKTELNYIVNSKDHLSDDDLVKALEVTKYYANILANNILTEKQKKDNIVELGRLTSNAQNLHGTIREIAEARIKEIASNNNVSGIDEAAQEGTMIGRLFGTISQNNNPIIKTFYKLMMKSRDKTERDSLAQNAKIEKALNNLKEWGKTRGLSGSDIFKDLLQYNDGKWTGNLISTYSPEFFTKRTIAYANKDSEWIKKNTTFNSEKYEADLAKAIEQWTKMYSNEENGEAIIAAKIADFKAKYDVNSGKQAYLYPKNKYLVINEEWRSAAWKELHAHGKDYAPLVFYKLFTDTISEFKEYLPLDEKGNFIPNIKNDFVDQVVQNGFSSIKGLGSSILQHMEAGSDETVGMVDHLTGERIKSIPLLYVNKLDANSKSKDLGTVLSIFSAMAFNYKHMAEVESTVHLLKDALSRQKVVLTNNRNKALKSGAIGDIQTVLNTAKDLEQFNSYVDYYLYGIKIQGKDVVFDVGNKQLSRNKIFSKVLSYFSAKSLTLNLVSGIANGIGGTSNLFFEGVKGRFFTNSDARKGYGKLIARNKTTLALMQYFMIDSADNSFKQATKLSVSAFDKHMTLDKLYFLQRSGDWLVENGTLLSMLESHTLKDGKIVKKEAKDKSLHDLAKIVNDKLVIEGLEEEEFNAFRRKVKYLYGTMKGNSNNDDINQVKLTMLGQMIMQFRNWIPRMAYERAGNLRYTEDLGVYEQGKYRSFLNGIINKQILPNIISTLANGGVLGFGKGKLGNKTVEGRAKELYAKALAADPNLKMTEEQFITMHKQNIRSTVLELQLLTAFGIMLIALKGDDDDDKDGLRRLAIKMINRNMDEIGFWLDPSSMQSILKKPIPVVSFGTDITGFFGDLLGNTTGMIIGDEEMTAKNRPVRKFNKLFPVGNAFEALWSVVDEDYNKKDVE